MTGRDVTFPGAGDVELAGRLDLPDGPVRATALFAHCFTCSHRSHAATRVSRALAARGVAVLRFDFTGLGGSGGEFAATTFSGNVADLVAAARWVEGELGPVSLLVGHSLGGAAVLAAAGDLPGVRAVVTIGAPAEPSHVTRSIEGLEHGADEDPGDEPLEVSIGGRPFRLRRRFLEDLSEQRQAERIAALRRPLLVMHSPADAVVPVDEARRIYEAARHPKSFVSLDDADHLLDERADAEYAADVIAAWSSRFLPEEVEPEDLADVEPLEDAVVVEELGASAAGEGYAHAVVAGSHRWLADEPPSLDGGDAGPNPYDLLLASLGACTSITLRMYARRQGWDLGTTRVELHHSRIHARDCAECEASSGTLDEVHRTLHLDPDLSPERRDRLVEIADRCPVHRTLVGEVRVVTALG